MLRDVAIGGVRCHVICNPMLAEIPRVPLGDPRRISALIYFKTLILRPTIEGLAIYALICVAAASKF